MEAKARDLVLMEEKYEALNQELYEVKRKVEVMDKVISEYESELSFLSDQRSEDQSKLKCTKNELEYATSKIQELESLLEEEKLNNHMLRIEISERKDKVNDEKVVNAPNEEEITGFKEQIQKLESEQEDSQIKINKLVEENSELVDANCQLKRERQILQDELTEIKELLQQKTNDLQNVKTSLESVREEKALLSTEMQVLKAADTHAPRGNSLFAEVEENRQKMAAQRELLKMKYLNLKKELSQKQSENNKLKLEIIKFRREEKEDDKNIHREYSELIRTYKERVSELEKDLRTLQQRNDQPIVFSGEFSTQLQWCSTTIENTRKEVRTLQEQLEQRGSNYVSQGNQLFESQKENRKLKRIILRMQSEIDELRLQLDTLKAGNQNVEDGISPPAIDVIIEYKKQKCVQFQKVLQERSATKVKEDNDKEN
ncbi:protein Spindly-like isoform X2 [Homalodisca vitripennis]|nr:protein Spindly-like isoform X2 [Homalodisca vitripennis]